MPKSKKFLMIFYAFLLLVFMLIVSACQPAPENTAVVNGGDLQQEIAASAAPLNAYETPANWQETLEMQGSNATIKIDAAVSVPDVSAFPVYNVRQTKFDVAHIQTLADYFTKGNDVYKQTEPTKGELEAELTMAKANLAKLKADPTSDESDIQDMEDIISEFEAQIPEAPESIEPEAITDWSPDKQPCGYFSEENGEDCYINVKPNYFLYMKGQTITESMRLSSDNPPVGDVAISEDKAISAAQKLLDDLDIDFMTAGRLEKAERFSSVEDAFSSDKEPLSKGYVITFVRNIDGIPGINNQTIMWNDNDDFDYKAPLYPEDIQIYVGDDGIPQSFVWKYPLEIKEKANENVSLLPFEKIQQRIRDMFTYINSYNSNITEITKIQLNMAIVNVKDQSGEAMYIPAWFIYFTEKYMDEKNKECTQESRLTINAIDGGRVMERPVGSP